MKKIVILMFVLFLFFVFKINNSYAIHELVNDGLVLKSASEYDYPPFSIVTDSNEADGFSVELLKASLKAMEMEAEFKVGPWAEIKDELAQGKLDVLPLVGRTPERELYFDFTIPYFVNNGAMFVRNGDTRINTIFDLKDKETLVMKGDNAEEFVRRENLSDKIITTETYEDAFWLLSSGQHDVVITQKITGQQLIKNKNFKNIVIVKTDLSQFRQDFSFAVKKGNAELLAKLNEGLSKIMVDGTYDKIYQKWLGDLIEKPLMLKDALKYLAIIIIPILLIFAVFTYFIKALLKEVKKRQEIENELIIQQKELKELNKNLNDAKKEVELKNKELEETLINFYTMRIGMQKDLELGKVKKENKKMKERIDELKNRKKRN